MRSLPFFTISLYRLYNPVIDAHFYTPSEAEKDAVIENKLTRL